MSVIPQLLPIEINSEERKNKVLTNIIKMLTERKLLNIEDENNNIKKIIATQTDEFLYKLTLDNTSFYYENNNENKDLYIKLINQKITGVTKSSGVSDFLHTYKNHQKIIVVTAIANKAQQHIESGYPKTEIFLERDFMINVIQHISVPKHILLDDDEANKVLEEYKAKKRNLPKIYTTDRIAKYYNMKPGQICRIIRPSETSGYVTSYRLVVKGIISGDK